MEKLIIEAAIHELISKQQNRNVPYGPVEVAECVKACVDAGLGFLHFHARDPWFGEMLWNQPELYKEGIQRMRALGISSELPWYPTYLNLSPEYLRHFELLANDPEVRLRMAPIDLGSGNNNDYDAAGKTFYLPERAKSWSHESHRSFFEMCRDLKLRPYLGVYEPSGLRSVAAYLDAGWLEPPLIMKFFISAQGPYGMPPTKRSVAMYAEMLEMIFPGVPKEWFVMCYGHAIWELAEEAIADGGHVRVGLGQYHPWRWPDPTHEEPTNAEQVARVVTMAKAAGRAVATPTEAAIRFGLTSLASVGQVA
jgi:uncharacterized protein (DUF849 family)